MKEEDILNLIRNDEYMMRTIQYASFLGLKDWVVGAGFVRNKVWDHLSGNNKKVVDTADIDLVYFDPVGNDENSDKILSEKAENETGLKWEIVNEFYAHKFNNIDPYSSTIDAISQWPETATAVGVTLENGQLKLIAPHGIDDLVNFVVRPSPKFVNRTEVIKDRVTKKKWKEKWPNLTFAF